MLSGTVFTARDQTHRRLVDALKSGKLPVRLKGQTIYYTGPTPAKPGSVIGSCGPTSSLRMDAFTPSLLAAGIVGMIGKGRRSEEVRKAIKKHGAVYFIVPGGAGALLSQKVRKCRLAAYPDLGAEAVYELEILDFPALVAIDCRANDVYRHKSGCFKGGRKC